MTFDYDKARKQGLQAVEQRERAKAAGAREDPVVRCWFKYIRERDGFILASDVQNLPHRCRNLPVLYFTNNQRGPGKKTTIGQLAKVLNSAEAKTLRRVIVPVLEDGGDLWAAYGYPLASFRGLNTQEKLAVRDGPVRSALDSMSCPAEMPSTKYKNTGSRGSYKAREQQAEQVAKRVEALVARITDKRELGMTQHAAQWIAYQASWYFMTGDDFFWFADWIDAALDDPTLFDLGGEG